MRASCSIEGCAKPVHGRSWCTAHYGRWRNHGSPLAGRTPVGEPSRFYREVVLAHEGEECLPWPYSSNGDGYGLLGHKYVHRLVCEFANGPAPTASHEAAHLCGNGHGSCVSRWHLQWKTPVENQADKISHGTVNAGERNGSAKLSLKSVEEIRSLKGKRTQSKIAQQFGVSRPLISFIHSGKNWSQTSTPTVRT